MPIDLGSQSRPDSPGALDDATNKKDKNYRRFASTVERALSLFDTALQEWADYISFLGRLLKALQSKPNGVIDVPHSPLIARRLAQCLDPRLPSGVHQKALEVYAYVFSILRKDGLSKDLALYLPGLAPTLSFASLSVKPILLSIFESYVLALDADVLQPALKAIVLALLPGLEEETSEEFERVHGLLDRLRRVIGQTEREEKPFYDVSRDRYFWQSIFLAAITSPSRRQGALQYLSRNLPGLGHENAQINGSQALSKPQPQELLKRQSPDVEAVISPEPGLLIRCFAAGLRDDQLLVQRGFLDLLVTKLPLSSVVIQHIIKVDDFDLLISAASSVVARREMSLNRRLWAWFLGPQSSQDTDETLMSPTLQTVQQGKDTDLEKSYPYFQSFGLTPLSRSLLKMIAESNTSPASRAKPFRICLALMDRSEIGNLVIPQIFTPIMESIQQYETIAPSADSFSEVLRSAHVFFDGIQSKLIWSEICRMIHESMDARGSTSNVRESEAASQKLDLVWFIITKFNVREEEMLTVHIPRACFLVLSRVAISVTSDEIPGVSKHPDFIRMALRIASRMLDLIPERAFDEGHTANTASIKSEGSEVTDEDMVVVYKVIMESYKYGSQATPSDAFLSSGSDMAKLLLVFAARLVTHASASIEAANDLDSAVSVFVKTIRKSSAQNQVDFQGILSSLLKSSASTSQSTDIDSKFPFISSLVSLFEFLSNVVPSGIWTTHYQIRQIAINLVTCLWASFSPNKPQHTVEATRCLWRLNSASPSPQLIESTICNLMVFQSRNNRTEVISLEGARRFAILWTQTTSKIRTSSDRRSSLGSIKKRGSRKSSPDTDEMDILARPLTLLLDSLSVPATHLYAFSVSWLQSLPSIQIIIDFLVYRLQNTEHVINVQNRSAEDIPPDDGLNASQTAAECLYYIAKISDILRVSPGNASISLKSPALSQKQTLDKAGRANPQEPPESAIEDDESPVSTRDFLISIAMEILKDHFTKGSQSKISEEMCRSSVGLLQHLLQGSTEISPDIDLEAFLIKILSRAIHASDILIQESLIETLLILLKIRAPQELQPFNAQTRNVPQRPGSVEKEEKGADSEQTFPTSELLDCLLLGISSFQNRSILNRWIRFLGEVLPLYKEHTFQILIPLVECFRKNVEEVFESLKAPFSNGSTPLPSEVEPITTINALLNGLEQTLARGHDQLTYEEANAPPVKSPDQTQGFFGNMVSGVFASEAQKPRSATANDRLTVLICFKDSVRMAFNMWAWGDPSTNKQQHKAGSSASFSYASIRLRNRARRLLERLFATEPLESLETLVEAWRQAKLSSESDGTHTTFNLLHALDASRPKNTMPATFNALYSRTSPMSLDSRRTSTLTSELSDSDLSDFLVEYTRSIDDDALDEIWMDCVAFLKDVLGNPMPQRQILPKLLDFIAILGEKIDNTNFGEQRRMRKEIGDLFVRLLAATFTVRPLAFSHNPIVSNSLEKSSEDGSNVDSGTGKESPDDIVTVLAHILPQISTLLVDTDRMTPVSTTISAQVLGPTFRSRRYPQNVTSSTLEILKLMSKIPEISKIWKKDVAEAFNDPKFFGPSTLSLAKQGWMPVMKQWALLDKDRMSDILSRLFAPTSAGIMFGVGASSARQEADRKAQLNLRRIAFLLISGDMDDFLVNVGGIQDKLVELSNATTASSPSSITRAEIFMVFRALILKVSTVHLASIWPVLNNELYNCLSSILEHDKSGPPYTITLVLQAAKLLDLLLTIAPDDFQLREWLYITDTIEAVYRTSDWKPVALVDNLAERLDSTAGATHQTPLGASAATFVDVPHRDGLRRPLLRWEDMQGVRRDQDMVDRVLRPFLRQLSITAFESMYQMEAVDREACVDELLRDLFDESTLV